MNPKPMPVAIEKVRGMAMAVITAGATSVISSQSISERPRTIKQATNNSAGAVANAGTVPASGDKNRHARNNRAMASCQDEAKEAGLGLWADDDPMAPWDWRRK